MPRGIRGAEVAGGEGIGAAALAYLRRCRGSAGGELLLGFRAAEVVLGVRTQGNRSEIPGELDAAGVAGGKG